MKRLALIPVLLAAGCTQGLIGAPSDAGADGVLVTSLGLIGATATPHTVTVGGRADEDGAADQVFSFSWDLADCDGERCLPADAGEGRAHVFRMRATDDAGEVVYKKVTVTLYP